MCTVRLRGWGPAVLLMCVADHYLTALRIVLLMIHKGLHVYCIVTES